MIKKYFVRQPIKHYSVLIPPGEIISLDDREALVHADSVALYEFPQPFSTVQEVPLLNLKGDEEIWSET